MEKVEKYRIYSLDLLRGLVMIIMALDHTRDFFHYDAFLHDPLNLNTTSPGLFFTRWITHYCAPIFVFLSGTSIFLQGLRKEKSELSTFLIKRGLWLILMEVIIISFLWTFDLHYKVFILQVIWAIGICMLLMGFIIRLPYKLILLSGSIIVLGHNILNYFPSPMQGFTRDLLFNGNFATHTFFGHNLVIIYPFVPWLGLMMLGYCFGKFYSKDYTFEKRRKILLGTGIGMILFFCLLRLTNIYGNPEAWVSQKNMLYTLLSFVNVHKYPPSLLFMLMTIGPALLFLAIFEKANNKISTFISIYGRVPFLYYILHFLLLHVLCMILFMFRGHSFFEAVPEIYGIPFGFMLVGEGYSLTEVYLIWITVVVSLYPICKWYSTFKKENNYWWLSYL
jgi:uncharacterized membrane protein